MKGTKKADVLRDDIINAFRVVKMPMNRSSLNRMSVAWILEKVPLKEFATFVQSKRVSDASGLDIESAFAQKLKPVKYVPKTKHDKKK
jgi:hypothetical protein